MADDRDDAERTEEPTQRRLEDAHKHGDVVKSQEVSTWFVMGGLSWTVPGVWSGPSGTPEWRVVYGFGLWSWRPGSIYLTYHDWGPNYRYGNGVISLGVNWAF